MKIAIVTVSDSSARGSRADASGPLLRSLLESSKKLGEVIVEDALVADEEKEISQKLIVLSQRNDVILTSGGTGFSARDVTPEATLAVIDKRCGGMETALHVRSLQATPLAALSRLVVGIRSQTLIVNLPGSPKAVKECFEVVEEVLLHAVQLITGDSGEVRETHRNLHND